MPLVGPRAAMPALHVSRCSWLQAVPELPLTTLRSCSRSCRVAACFTSPGSTPKVSAPVGFQPETRLPLVNKSPSSSESHRPILGSGLHRRRGHPSRLQNPGWQHQHVGALVLFATDSQEGNSVSVVTCRGRSPRSTAHPPSPPPRPAGPTATPSDGVAGWCTRLTLKGLGMVTLNPKVHWHLCDQAPLQHAGKADGRW